MDRTDTAPAWFGSLAPSDRPLIAAHWARMSEDCLRRRFLRPMGPEALKARAQETFDGGAHVIGWFREGVLRGVGELFPGPNRTGEASFTVEPSFRKSGIGHGLLARVLERARNLGLSKVVIVTTRHNRPMVRVAERAGAEITRDGDEVIAVCRLAPPSPASLAIDALAEAGGAAAAMGDALRRIARSWTEGRGPWGSARAGAETQGRPALDTGRPDQ